MSITLVDFDTTRHFENDGVVDAEKSIFFRHRIALEEIVSATSGFKSCDG